MGSIDEFVAFLMMQGAAQLPHGARNLLAHLRGTHDIFVAWGQPEYLCRAGLFHSIYSTHSYRRALVDLTRRDEIQAVIGAEAEALVLAFCTLRREECEGDLALMHAANLAEQSQAQGGSPAPWLSSVARLAELARDKVAVFPSVFSDEFLALGEGDERDLITRYLTAMNPPSFLNPDDCFDALAEVSSKVPFVGEPMLLVALWHLEHGREADAISLARRAVEVLRMWGTAWDKRLSFGYWLGLGMFLQHPQSAHSVAGSLPFLKLHTAVRERRSAASAPSEFNAPEQTHAGTLHPRLQRYFGQFRGNQRTPRMMAYPELRSQPWYDAGDFGLARDLEESAQAIIAEFQAIPAHELHPESERIARTGAWDIFMLYERGLRRDENCARCPTVTEIIERHRTVTTLAGLAYFSRLAPGSVIEPHRGATNMRLRCHLGVIVPEGCGITVDGVTRRWEAGRCLVFDDFFEHSAWNQGTGERVVLVIDLWHPDLTDDEVFVLEGLHRYANAHAVGLRAYWDANQNTRKQNAGGQNLSAVRKDTPLGTLL